MSEIEEKEELLEYFLSNLNENDNPIYYETLPKEKIVDYLDEGFSLDNVFFYLSPPIAWRFILPKRLYLDFRKVLRTIKE